MKKNTFFLTSMLLIILVTVTSLPLFAGADLASGADLLYKYGFISGSNGDLMLTKSLTRAEVAVILAEMKGLKSEAANFALPSQFADVAPEAWYASYISYGQSRGYLNGYPDGTYHPESNVTSKEFAAFILNAMGYNGDYTFNNALSYAETKQITIKTSGYTFNRGDAFEALWAAVNQPLKGSDVPLGVALGKLNTSSSSSDAVVTTNSPLTKIELESPKKFIITFNTPVDDTSRFAFKVTRGDHNVLTSTSWNASKSIATLSSNTSFTTGDYKVAVLDTTYGTPVIYYSDIIPVEKEKADKFVLNSNALSLYNNYLGAVSFSVYNQYGDNITTSALARELTVECSLSGATSTADFNSGLLTVAYGSPTSGKSLLDIKNVTIYAYDTISSLSFNAFIPVSTENPSIETVQINGIVNEDGNFVDFIYDTTKDYYLDISVVDSSGTLVKSKQLLDTDTPGQNTFMVTSSNPSVVTIQKVTHPSRSSEIAYKIVFMSPPTQDLALLFTAVAPFSTGSDTSDVFSTTLFLKK